MLKSKNNEIEMIFKFLSIVKENPNINQTGILTRCNEAYKIIMGLKSILVSAGFCKISSANTISSKIVITNDGQKLLEYLERLITHN